MKHVAHSPYFPAVLLAVGLLLPMGCGGGGSADSGSRNVQAVPTLQTVPVATAADSTAEGLTRGVTLTVTVSPATLTLNVGKSETFTASVVGSDNKKVIWSVQEGSAGGTITDGGRYTAPTKPGTYHVVAKSAANGDKKAIATVTVKAEQPAITITIAPTTLSIIVKKSETFTATVTGSDNKGVIWSVQEGAAGGTITDGGRYTAPAVPGAYHVIATSKANGDKKAIATVTVKADPAAAITVTVKPVSLTIAVRKSETFTATVTGTDNKAVIWSVQEGSKGGTITDGGRYTAPSTPGTYHVIATSKANPDKKAIVTVTVKAA